MSRSERLLLLVFFAVVLVVLSRSELTSTAAGAVVGAVPAVLVAGRLKRLSERMDRRLVEVEQRRSGLRREWSPRAPRCTCSCSGRCC